VYISWRKGAGHDSELVQACFLGVVVVVPACVRVCVRAWKQKWTCGSSCGANALCQAGAEARAGSQRVPSSSIISSMELQLMAQNQFSCRSQQMHLAPACPHAFMLVPCRSRQMHTAHTCTHGRRDHVGADGALLAPRDPQEVDLRSAGTQRTSQPCVRESPAWPPFAWQGTPCASTV
jgi:hypothetical protein